VTDSLDGASGQLRAVPEEPEAVIGWRGHEALNFEVSLSDN
jgi:hypothetical protein